jgi:hypothetical protein
MDDDTARCLPSGKRPRGRAFGVSLAIVGLATVGLLAAACGGGSKHPGAAGRGGTATATAGSGSSSTDSSGQASQAQELQLAQCMRSHGVPKFPDPSANGTELQAIENSGVNPRTPTYQAALQACKKYTPEGSLTPAQSAAENAKGVEMSQCMRSHGVPDFPDPTTGPTGAQVINLTGLGIDPSSPAFQAAQQACQRLFPGSK